MVDIFGRSTSVTRTEVDNIIHDNLYNINTNGNNIDGLPTSISDLNDDSSATSLGVLNSVVSSYVQKVGDIMGSNLTIPTPTNSGHAANKNYVDTQDNLKLNLNGGTLSGILNMNGNNIQGLPINILQLIDSTSACSYGIALFLIQELQSICLLNTGGTMSGSINMNNNYLNFVHNPSVGTDGTNKNYVDTNDNLKLDKSGGTMTGNLIMSGYFINNIHDIILANYAVSKQYSDANDNLKLNKSGGTMSGILNMGGFGITSVPNPTLATDVAPKSYVDAISLLSVYKAGDAMTGILSMGNNRVTNVGDPIASQDSTNMRYVLGRQIKNQVGYINTLISNIANKCGITLSASSEFNTSYQAWKSFYYVGSPLGANTEWATAGVNSG